MNVCPVCGEETTLLFHGQILRHHRAAYHQCTSCRFVHTDPPFWLEEAYKEPINREDVGLLQRNVRFSRQAAIILYALFGEKGVFVDYAGGYGIFTRLMRDVGFDFYWQDRYTTNLFAQGFEYEPSRHTEIALLTSFEAFEHFVDPVAEMDRMIAIAPNILFSTQLLPSPTPSLGAWWYYQPDHGQHVSFYSYETCVRLAARFGLHFVSFGELHLFSRHLVHHSLIRLLLRRSKYGVERYIASRMKSRTQQDFELVRQSMRGNIS